MIGRSRCAAGFVTPAFVATVGLTMVLLVAVANVLVVRYAEGVLQAAVEEAVRQGAAVGDVAACVARADQVVRTGLGRMADEVGPAVCAIGADGVSAQVSATFTGWVPIVPVRQSTATATTRSPARG